MKTPEQQIRSLKLAVGLSWFTSVMLAIMYVKAGRIHHVEVFYAGNDVVVVTVEGNNSLDFLFPFQQTIAIEDMLPPSPGISAVSGGKTSVRSWQGSFKGPGIYSPFLRKQEGTQNYEVANVCENMKRLVRDPEGNWALEPKAGNAAALAR